MWAHAKCKILLRGTLEWGRTQLILRGGLILSSYMQEWAHTEIILMGGLLLRNELVLIHIQGWVITQEWAHTQV